MPRIPARSLAWLALAASLAFIGFFTLRPSVDNVSGIQPFCLLCGERGTADLVLNVVLFTPLGLALGFLGVRWSRAAMVGGSLALAIEIAQSVIPGRAPTWRDVAMNGAGAAVGAQMVGTLPALVRLAAQPALGPAAAAVGVVIAAGTVWGTGWLLAPAVKPSPWFGLLAPRLAVLEHWEGRVDTVRVGSERIVTGALTNQDAVRAAVAARAPLRIVGTAGPAPAGLAPVLMLADDVQEEMLLVGQDGDDLIVRERRRSSVLRLFEPEHRFAGLWSAVPVGAPFALDVALSARAACATLGERHRCVGPFAAGAGWSLLYWRRGFSSNTQQLLGMLTFALAWWPLGLVTATWTPQRVLLVGAVAGLAVCLAALASGLALPTALEWGAALGGLLAGRVLGQRIVAAECRLRVA